MSITATRFATKTRTWLLIAGLTGLLIAIGGVIGGSALYLFAALAVLMNVVGYWFSDKLALRASRAQPVEPGTLPEIEAMVQDLAHRAKVPVPRLYLIPSEQPNAFATGRNPKHAAVAVTQGLLQYLPPDQVKACSHTSSGTSRTATSSSRRSRPWLPGRSRRSRTSSSSHSSSAGVTRTTDRSD
jgi:Zn-dependent protease with chaperone function